jgi:hypothetical protein
MKTLQKQFDDIVNECVKELANDILFNDKKELSPLGTLILFCLGISLANMYSKIIIDKYFTIKDGIAYLNKEVTK